MPFLRAKLACDPFSSESKMCSNCWSDFQTPRCFLDRESPAEKEVGDIIKMPGWKKTIVNKNVKRFKRVNRTA